MKRRNLKKWNKKVKLREERNIIDNCLINPIVLQKIVSESALCQHAIREFNIANFNKCNYGSIFSNGIIELLAVLSSQGHTNNSIIPFIKLFTSLAKYEVITPLTLSDDEFEKDSKDFIDNSKQNLRKSSIYKYDDNTIIDYDAFTKMPIKVYHYDTKKWEKVDNKICWCGGNLYEHENNILTGRYFRNCAIKIDKDGTYTPKNKVIVPCVEIDIDKYECIMCVSKNENRLKILNKQFNIIWKIDEKIKGIDITDCEILSKIDI